MGILLKFEPRAKRTHKRPNIDNEMRQSCEIIILPCVRYERELDSGTKPTAAKKKSRKRRSRARG